MVDQNQMKQVLHFLLINKNEKYFSPTLLLLTAKNITLKIQQME